MNINLSFYLIDHWLIALAMLAVLIVASEIGYRKGIRKRELPESDRSLMSGTSAAMLGLLGLLLGVFGGLGLAFFREYFDSSIKDTVDVEEKLGLPVLASIPCKVA